MQFLYRLQSVGAGIMYKDERTCKVKEYFIG